MKHYVLGLLALSSLTSALGATDNVVKAESSTFRFSSQGHAMMVNTRDAEEADSKASNTLIHENQLSAEFKEVQADLTFSNRFNPSGNKETNSYFVVEKKTLSHTWGDGKVTAGDSHQELGRGIALSLYRDTAFGVDNTLEGIAIKQSLGDVSVLRRTGSAIDRIVLRKIPSRRSQ